MTSPSNQTCYSKKSSPPFPSLEIPPIPPLPPPPSTAPGRSRLGGFAAAGAAGGRDRGLRRDPPAAALRGAAELHGVPGAESLGAAL
jgi:hypothetical protein